MYIASNRRQPSASTTNSGIADLSSSNSSVVSLNKSFQNKRKRVRSCKLRRIYVVTNVALKLPRNRIDRNKKKSFKIGMLREREEAEKKKRNSKKSELGMR